MKHGICILCICLFALLSINTDSQAQEKFSIKAVGAFGSMSAGDINEMIDYLNYMYKTNADWYLSNGFENTHAYEGSLQTMGWGFEYGLECIYRISPSFGIGIGVEIVNRTMDAAKKHIWYSGLHDRVYNYLFDYDYELKAIPIHLNAYYYYPVFARGTIYGQAGFTYSFCEFRDVYTWKNEYLYGSSQLMMSTEYFHSDFKVKDDGPGFTVGLGFEMGKWFNSSVFIECSYRYCKLNNFKGDSYIRYLGLDKVSGQTEVIELRQSGTLVYVELKEPPFLEEPAEPITLSEETALFTETISFVNIHSDAFKQARNFEVNLSGFSIRAGLRIGLF